MAELLLVIGDRGERFKDGDILCAFSDRQINCTHAEHIVDVTKIGFNSDGLRPAGLTLDAMDIVYQYRFERLNAMQVKRTETDHLGNVIDVSVVFPPHMHAQEFIDRRRRHPKHRIFGAVGAEIWHGGRVNVSQPALDEVWTKIEHHTPQVRSQEQFRWWPHNPDGQDVRSFLPVATTSFTDEEAEQMVAPATDETGEVTHHRNRNIDWKAEVLRKLRGVGVAQVIDRFIAVDQRREMEPQDMSLKQFDKRLGRMRREGDR